MSAVALLFDMDGVLVDSHVVAVRCWERFAARHGLELEPILARMHGRRSLDVVGEFAPWLDVAAEAAAFDAEEAADMDGLVPVAGAPELLARLDPARWAVVTSADTQLASTRLPGAGLPLPRVLVTADDVARGKPDPAPYLLAAARLGVPPAQCVVLEDAPAGIASGLAAGAAVIGVTSWLPPAAIRELGAVATVADLRELPAALDALGLALPL